MSSFLAFEDCREPGFHPPGKPPVLLSSSWSKMAHLPPMLINECADICIEIFPSLGKDSRTVCLFQDIICPRSIIVRLMPGAMSSEMTDIKRLESFWRRSILYFIEDIRTINRCSKVRILIYPFFDRLSRNHCCNCTESRNCNRKAINNLHFYVFCKFAKINKCPLIRKGGRLLKLIVYYFRKRIALHRFAAD